MNYLFNENDLPTRNVKTSIQHILCTKFSVSLRTLFPEQLDKTIWIIRPKSIKLYLKISDDFYLEYYRITL